jgi:CheY-like chemotaxis protein
MSRILLVEDSVINQNIFKTMLEDLACCVDLASTGLEALQKMISPSKHYDLVIMDIGLPDISGLEVVSQYRAQESSDEHLVIVALSGHGSEKNQQEFIEVGLYAFLLNPLMRKDAKALVGRWIHEEKIV